MRSYIFIGAAFLVFAAFLFSGVSFAQNSKTLEDGITYYRQENYDEALSVLKKAREEDATSSLAAYYLGLTYKQLQDYKEAKKHLIDAVTLTPKIKGALLELIEVLYQLNELDEAMKYVEIAEKEGIRPAQTAFLKGLVLLKQDKNLEAVESFKTAKQMDESLKQTADYQIGIAYLKAKKFTEAKESLKEVVVFDPNSNLSYFANQYLDAVKRKEELERPLKFTLGGAMQYDDNVLLKPSDDTVAADITNNDDWREVVTFNGEYDKRFGERWGLSAQYFLYWAKENDIGSYDVLSNTAVLTPSLYFPNATVGVPVSYNDTIVGDKDYLRNLSVTPVCNFRIGKSQLGLLLFKYRYKDFTRTPTTGDENRDSNEYGGGVGWFIFFMQNRGFFNLRYELSEDATKGRNWRYLGNKGTATLVVPIFEKLKASVIGEAFLQDFDKTHTVYNVKREDKVYTLSAMLSYDIFKNTQVQLQYTHVKDDSNIAVYDYNRNIYSAGLEFKF